MFSGGSMSASERLPSPNGAGTARQVILKDGSLRHYFNSIRNRCLVALEQLPAARKQEKSELIDQIEVILKSVLSEIDATVSQSTISRMWAEANRAEQLLSFLLTGSMLDRELDHQLTEADEKGLRGAAAQRQALEQLSNGTSSEEVEAAKQALLFSVVSDMQHLAQKRYQIRGMRERAVRFVSWIALVTIAFVGLPLALYILHLGISVHRNSFDGATIISRFVGSFPNFGLFTATSFGALGALFSQFLILQKSDLDVPRDDARTYYSRIYIVLRIVIGTVGAIVVYFFLASGLIDGPLVPKMGQLAYLVSGAGQSPEGMQTFLGTWTSKAMVPSKDMALLIVWSFLAGFSEQLVPNVLTTTSNRVEAKYDSQSSAQKPS